MRSLSPVAPDERIHALDMLRGLAMFGALWSNLNDWYGTIELRHYWIKDYQLSGIQTNSLNGEPLPPLIFMGAATK